MTPEKPKPQRPLKTILSLLVLFAFGVWVNISLYEDKGKQPAGKLAVSSPDNLEKPTPAPILPATKSATEKVEANPVPAPTLGPVVVEKPTVLMKEPGTLPLVVAEKPAMRLPDVIAPPVAMAPEKITPPIADDLPKIPPPMETPPKDVSSSKATTRDR